MKVSINSLGVIVEFAENEVFAGKSFELSGERLINGRFLVYRNTARQIFPEEKECDNQEERVILLCIKKYCSENGLNIEIEGK